jgi:hypothetical protein
MIEWWYIYLFTRLDAIKSFLYIPSIFLLIFGAFFIICGGVIWHLAKESPMLESSQEKLIWAPKLVEKYGPIFLCVSFFLGAINTAIPSTKEVAAIIILPKIANNETVQEVPNNVATLLNEKFKAWIDETLQEPK